MCNIFGSIIKLLYYCISIYLLNIFHQKACLAVSVAQSIKKNYGYAQPCLQRRLMVHQQTWDHIASSLRECSFEKHLSINIFSICLW